MSPVNIKSHCNTCGRETHHHVLHEEKHEQVDQDPEYGPTEWWTHYWMLSCAGCDSVSLRVDRGGSEFYDDKGQPEVSTQHYPPRMFRPKPRWASDPGLIFYCPSEIQELLHEVYICLHNDCRRAAAMAARALLEHIFVKTCGDKGTFTENVKSFEAAGHLSLTQKELLETAIDAGHASIHRSFKPSERDLCTVVDIVESLVELLYVQKYNAEQLKGRIPSRK